jgi:hypothetical protein
MRAAWIGHLAALLLEGGEQGLRLLADGRAPR